MDFSFNCVISVQLMDSVPLKKPFLEGNRGTYKRQLMLKDSLSNGGIRTDCDLILFHMTFDEKFHNR